MMPRAPWRHPPLRDDGRALSRNETRVGNRFATANPGAPPSNRVDPDATPSPGHFVERSGPNLGPPRRSVEVQADGTLLLSNY
jgi:hypothetical protein